MEKKQNKPPKQFICENPVCDTGFFKQFIGQKHCSPKCYYTCKPKSDKKPKPIKQVSDKRKIEDAEYRVLRKNFLALKENKFCKIYPHLLATEVHHTYSGKDRAKYYLDVSTWLAVSRDGHNWVHDNPKEAREKGFLK